jgi:crotonobetainyl-CoA:carnitine CoA-transferase CaiB-like acyl-CoA transferase
MTGPRAAEGGYDYMMQGLAGWMSLTGEPDGPPTKSGLSLVDLSGGYTSALALLGGVWRARRDGVGCDCDVSLFETALHELMYVGTWAATHGYQPPRRPNSSHPSIVPFGNFPTADGWIVIAAPKPKFWTLFCDAIGRPDLLADERFADFAGRDRHRDALVPELERTLRERTTDDWVAALTAAGVPNAKINDVPGALAEPQTVARAAIVEYEHERLGRVRQLASPLRVEGEPNPVARAPRRGEHTEQVLVELCGYTRERVRELSASGVFGDVAIG